MSSAPSRSSRDAVGIALDSALVRVHAALAKVQTAFALVLIDGRSGAGKSTLARRLVETWPGERADLLALDSVYPGWDGLDEGAELVRDLLLTPRSRGETGTWYGWDWTHDVRAEAHTLPASRALVVEGVGILRPDTVRFADVSVWCESPAVSRRDRALARDGDTYRPHWERWARQEDAHIAAHDPASLASVYVDVP